MVYFEDRLFLAFRTAPYHFASNKVKIYIISSKDNATKSWDFEHEIFLDSDMREPFLFVFNNTLHFSFFEAGTNFFYFQP